MNGEEDAELPETVARELGDLVAKQLKPLSPALRERVLAPLSPSGGRAHGRRAGVSFVAFALVAAGLGAVLLHSPVAPPPAAAPSSPRDPVASVPTSSGGALGHAHSDHADAAAVASLDAPQPDAIANLRPGDRDETVNGANLLTLATPAEIHSFAINNAITATEERELLVALANVSNISNVAGVDSNARAALYNDVNMRVNFARKRNLEILERDSRDAARDDVKRAATSR